MEIYYKTLSEASVRRYVCMGTWTEAERAGMLDSMFLMCVPYLKLFHVYVYVCTEEPTKVDGWQSAERKGHGPYSPVWCKHTVAKHVWSVINFNNITLP